MITKFTVDPNNYALEYLSGNDKFWQNIKEYKNEHYPNHDNDFWVLNLIVKDLLYKDAWFSPDITNNGNYGIITTQNKQKFTISDDTFAVLENISADDQQAILTDIANALMLEK